MYTFDSIRINYYHACFYNTKHDVFRQIVDTNSHPILWMKVQKELDNPDWIVVSWREITKEEYMAFLKL